MDGYLVLNVAEKFQIVKMLLKVHMFLWAKMIKRTIATKAKRHIAVNDALKSTIELTRKTYLSKNGTLCPTTTNEGKVC